MEEGKEIDSKYPTELFENLNEEDKKDLESKLDLVEDTSNLFYIKSNKKYYYSGIKYLTSLCKKLTKEDLIKFWEEFKTNDLISDINDTEKLTKLLMNVILNLDGDVEALHLIVKNYFKRIITIIKNK